MDSDHLPALAGQQTRTLPPIRAASCEPNDGTSLGGARSGAGPGAGAGSAAAAADTATPAPWQYPTLGQSQRAHRASASPGGGGEGTMDRVGDTSHHDSAHHANGDQSAPSAVPARPGSVGSGDADEGASGEGGDTISDHPGTPVHSPLPAALLKRFSSQCLRSSVWPSALDLTPVGGYGRLGQGKRVTDDVVRSGALRVHCCAWNLHAKEPPEDLAAMLPPGQFHVYAVGSSECVHSIAASVVMRDKSKWESAIRKAIGPGYTKIRSHVLQAIHLVVFAHDDILPLVSDVQSAAVACGVANTLGNKGGVGIAFQVGATSLLFVSCHLAAHQKRVQQRNSDFERIATCLPLRAPRRVGPHHDAGSEAMVTDLFDRVVFLGDMNYRINGTRAMIDSLISSSMHEVLLFNDQLRIEMKKGAVFPGFEEGPLHFAPTYKFDANSDAYDSSKKQRIPAWTDRILFKAPKGSMRLQAYDSIPSIRSSDHRPVVAVFEVDVAIETQAGAATQSQLHAASPEGPSAKDSEGGSGGDINSDDTMPDAPVRRSPAPGEGESVRPPPTAAATSEPAAAVKLGESRSQVCAIQ